MYKFYREITSGLWCGEGGNAMEIMINNNDIRSSPALNMYNKFSSSRRDSTAEKRMSETRREEKLKNR